MPSGPQERPIKFLILAAVAIGAIALGLGFLALGAYIVTINLTEIVASGPSFWPVAFTLLGIRLALAPAVVRRKKSSNV